jgi:hypothetical protein
LAGFQVVAKKSNIFLKAHAPARFCDPLIFLRPLDDYFKFNVFC